MSITRRSFFGAISGAIIVSPLLGDSLLAALVQTSPRWLSASCSSGLPEGDWSLIWTDLDWNIDQSLTPPLSASNQQLAKRHVANIRDLQKIREEVFGDKRDLLNVMIVPAICTSYRAVGLLTTIYGEAEYIRKCSATGVGFANEFLQDANLRMATEHHIRHYCESCYERAFGDLRNA